MKAPDAVIVIDSYSNIMFLEPKAEEMLDGKRKLRSKPVG